MSVPSAGGYDPARSGGRVQRSRRSQRRAAAVEGATVVKDRVEIAKDTAVPAVVDSKPGPVTAIDKAKGYYHTIIIVVTGLLAFLNQVGPLGEMLPEGGIKSFVTGAILFVGAILTFLKSNEVWVNRL